MDFEILGAIRAIETIAAGRALRQLGACGGAMGVRTGENARVLLLFALVMGRSAKQRYTGTRLTE